MGQGQTAEEASSESFMDNNTDTPTPSSTHIESNTTKTEERNDQPNLTSNTNGGGSNGSHSNRTSNTKEGSNNSPSSLPSEKKEGSNNTFTGDQAGQVQSNQPSITKAEETKTETKPETKTKGTFIKL